MMKICWAPVELGVRVKACLRAMTVGIVASCVALPAIASGHPVRPAMAHSSVSHPTSLRRGVAAPKAKAGTVRKHQPPTKSAGHAAKPEAKSRRHKRPKYEEADNDPVTLSRARGHRVKAAKAPTRTIAARNVEAEPLRKVVAPAAAETFERGESRPEDDERLTVRHVRGANSQAVPAIVTATPETVRPMAMSVSPETPDSAADSTAKVDAVLARKPVTGRGRAKASVLPEDHAGRVDVINEAMTPMILPKLRTRNGRLIVPPPMKGSWDILVHQNTMADSEGLDRIQDDEDLDRLRAKRLLVPLAGSRSLLVNAELPENRRYARPWAARFAADTARAFYSRFHQPLRLNSAVRTVAYQIRLQRVNGNAAAVDGDGASPHLTGQALDFGKRGMNTTQIAWMRAYLSPLMKGGKLDVEEEFQQACFHVSVYKSYLPAVKTKLKGAATVAVAQAHPDLPVRAGLR